MSDYIGLLEEVRNMYPELDVYEKGTVAALKQALAFVRSCKEAHGHIDWAIVDALLDASHERKVAEMKLSEQMRRDVDLLGYDAVVSEEYIESAALLEAVAEAATILVTPRYTTNIGPSGGAEISYFLNPNEVYKARRALAAAREAGLLDGEPSMNERWQR